MEMQNSQLQSVPHAKSCTENTTQETSLKSTIHGAENENVSDLQATWNDINDLELHSSEKPIVIHFKTENDI